MTMASIEDVVHRQPRYLGPVLIRETGGFASPSFDGFAMRWSADYRLIFWVQCVAEFAQCAPQLSFWMRHEHAVACELVGIGIAGT